MSGLLHFTNNANIFFNDRNATLILLVDLSKAFDCLPYTCLQIRYELVSHVPKTILLTEKS